MMVEKKSQDSFQDFMDGEPVKAPHYVQDSVSQRVSRDLNPSTTQIFIKIAMVQLFVGIISLVFCPQFELSLSNNYELFHFFHRTFGELICMALCGGIFTGSGALMAGALLSREELRAVKSSRYLIHLALSGIFLGCFFMLGVEAYWQAALYWFIGSYIFSCVSFDLSAFRRRWQV